ncbi:MAG: hypothetical protein HQL54_13610 [Magnetococcales bacterium]|nr:hypothetical protein [Magnetococcales bacterium]
MAESDERALKLEKKRARLKAEKRRAAAKAKAKAAKEKAATNVQQEDQPESGKTTKAKTRYAIQQLLSANFTADRENFSLVFELSNKKKLTLDCENKRLAQLINALQGLEYAAAMQDPKFQGNKQGVTARFERAETVHSTQVEMNHEKVNLIGVKVQKGPIRWFGFSPEGVTALFQAARQLVRKR